MSLKVLIAEDEWLTALALRSQVESHGFEVVATVGTGAEAVEACALTPPDLVLMDVQMPVMDGLQATRELMERAPTCVVIVTGRGQLQEVAEQAGAMECVTKPLLPHLILPLVEASRRRFRYFLRCREEAADPGEALQDWVAVHRVARQLAAAGGSVEEALSRLEREAAARGLTLLEASREISEEAG